MAAKTGKTPAKKVLGRKAMKKTQGGIIAVKPAARTSPEKHGVAIPPPSFDQLEQQG